MGKLNELRQLHLERSPSHERLSVVSIVSSVIGQARAIVKNEELDNVLDSVKEAGRPRNVSNEYVSGEESKMSLGMVIKSTIPEVPGSVEVRRVEPMEVKLILECTKPVPLRDLSAWAYTCLLHMDNLEGVYTEVALPYVEGSRDWDDVGVTTYTFRTIIYPTEVGEYRLTYNVKFQDSMVWSNEFGEDSLVTVVPALDSSQWCKDDTVTPITMTLNIGSIGALTSNGFYFDRIEDEESIYLHEGDFDAVFSLDESVVVDNMDEDSFLQLLMDRGTAVEIPKSKLELLVTALRKLEDTREKVLVVDTEGLGRVGSALTSYIFANNPCLTFEEALDYVRKRRVIYCHKGLRKNIEEMFPRA